MSNHFPMKPASEFTTDNARLPMAVLGKQNVLLRRDVWLCVGVEFVEFHRSTAASVVISKAPAADAGAAQVLLWDVDQNARHRLH